MYNDIRALRHELDALEDSLAGVDLITAINLVGDNLQIDPLGVVQDALRLPGMTDDPLTPPAARVILQLIEWSGEPLARVARVLELIALLDD